jgi:hypothetical protein
MGTYYQELNDADKERLREQMTLERRKIVQEHAVVELAETCERRHGHLRATLDQAARACMSGDRGAASETIANAIAIEGQQRQDIQRLQDMEKRLLALTKLKLRREGS